MAANPRIADPVPPDPTPGELVDRAAELRPMLRERQADAEARGHYDEDVHERLVDAGLYRLLTPKRYGGLEYDLATYARVIIEIARGDPSTAWCYCLGHNHNLTTASHWPARAQDELFDRPYFRSPHSVAGAVTAVPIDGGYRVSGRSPYQSGVPYSTHVTVNAVVEGGTGPDGGPEMRCVIIPREQVEVLDDWGGERTLGLRGSGSNTVVVEDAEVPAHHTCAFDWLDHDYDAPSPGVRLHGNPLYLGPVAGYFHLALAAPIVGAAQAAVDEYEEIIGKRTMPFAPGLRRRDDPFHQSDLGMAMTMTDSAEAICVHVGELHLQYCTDAVERGIPFTMEKDARLYGMCQRAAQLASEAIELLFRSAGTSAAAQGHPMQRYYRDAAMLRGHNSSQYAPTAMKIAQVHMGMRKRPL